ncbi:MAG: response regulator, partial [Candidatus Omnitrophica bacterium]|nr:response regulator [Candidatus Omnitrophota bacterium]
MTWKILVVDDHKTNRGLIIAMMKVMSKNYEFLEAETGEGALEIIKQTTPDLILMDVMMPGMSGFEACQILRNDNQYKSIPLIFVTGATDEISKIRSMEVGGSDYITKPINIDQLNERVAIHLRARRILVIDDEPEIVAMLFGILSKKGFEVITANSGAEGLKKFKELDIHLVLCDVRMPGLSGIDILSEVKKLNSDTVFIVMTGYASMGDSIQAVRLGAYDYLTKPFENPEEVVHVCQRGFEYFNFIMARKHLITTLKRLNKEILDKSNQLEIAQAQLVQAAKLAAMGELGAGIAHEMNQPLMGITMYIQSIMKRDSVKSDDAVLDTLEKIKKQLQRMTAVVANLRTFARDTKPRYEEVSINDPLSEGFSLLRQQMIDHSIEAEIVLGENLPKVIGDSNRLQQVFINIIANAKDALDEMTEKQDKHVWVVSKLGCAHRMVEIKVTDNGPGIDQATLERIFDPFFTTKPEGKGTGLGLSITYGIIQDHHACILIDSEP